MQNLCKCEMNIGNTQFLIDGLEDFSNHFYWLSGTCKAYAVDNGIQKSKSCNLLVCCCIYNSLNSSAFIVFILGGKYLLQSLELSNYSLVWKQFSDFLHIARREKSDPALNNADLLVIKVRCFSLCKLITVILSFQRRTSLWVSRLQKCRPQFLLLW